MSNKTLSLIITDMINNVNYLNERLKQQHKANQIDQANITLENIKTVRSWYKDLLEIITVEKNKLFIEFDKIDAE